MVNLELLANALVVGLLIGGFYAAMAVGVTIAFGMLDIVNIAHPAFVMLGAFSAYYLNVHAGLDPLLAAIVTAPFAYVIGRLLYRVYYHAFERHGGLSLQGLCFFFGVLFIVEIGLLLTFGVDYRSVQASYIDSSYSLGFVSFPMRLVVPFVVAALIVGSIHLYLNRSFKGAAVLAVSQDPGALRLVGENPVRIKEMAFGLSIVTAIVAGALLIIIQPVEPSLGREFIGRVFAICVLGGLTSLGGTLLASIILGIGEALTSTFVGPSWSPAVAFTLLLVTLAIRPEGIFRR